MVNNRISRLQQKLKRQSISVLFITSLTNIVYLTGIQLTSGLLCMTRKDAVLFVHSLYAEMASEHAKSYVSVRDISQVESMLRRHSTIALESQHVTLAQLTQLKVQYKNKKFVQTIDLVESLRRAKDAKELRSIAVACGITKKALAHVPKVLRTGITEKELAAELTDYCRKLGADTMAFESIVGFGENTSKPHHRPTHRMLKHNDIVQIDMGARYENYCSDFSRVFFMTTPTKEQKKAYTALKQAKKAAENMLRPGVLNTALDTEARRVLKLHGYDKEFCHSLGHGVGLDIHEGVTLSAQAKPMKLQKNEVITLEPGLYLEGQWGMRLEDTYRVRGV